MPVKAGESLADRLYQQMEELKARIAQQTTKERHMKEIREAIDKRELKRADVLRIAYGMPLSRVPRKGRAAGKKAAT